MVKKIKKYYQNIRWQQFQDARLLGLLLFLIIVLLVTWSGVKTIQTNYSLEKQISRLQQEVEVQQLINNNEALKNTYFQTNQYLELAARQNFGLSAPGETELIISKSVALAHLSNSVVITDNSKISSPEPIWQRNFQAWINFFLNRQNITN
jgi:cell division protein FtsB